MDLIFKFNQFEKVGLGIFGLVDPHPNSYPAKSDGRGSIEFSSK